MKKTQGLWVLTGCLFLITAFSGCAGTNATVSTSTNSAAQPVVSHDPQMPAGIHTMGDAINDLKKVLENTREGENIGAFFETNYLFRYNLAGLVISKKDHQKLYEGIIFDEDASAIYFLSPPSITLNHMKGITVLEDRLEIGSRLVIPYADLPCWPIHSAGRFVWLGGKDDVALFFQPKYDEYAKAERVANDLFFIQQHFKTCSYKEKAAQFEALAKQYREQNIKPVISEEQRKYIVQANLCTREKDYTGAIELYRKAIAENPVAYPAAYFNLAMLTAQLKWYQGAINYMKQYLMLVPDAKDARSAQDKIYEWELMIKKQA